MTETVEDLLAEFMEFMDGYLIEYDDDNYYAKSVSREVELELRHLISKVILLSQDEGVGEP